MSEAEEASENYRSYREGCGIMDPVMLDEIEEAHYAGAKWDVQRIISIIESRIAEILGDAQPAPVLRAELRGLIDKIKEESK